MAADVQQEGPGKVTPNNASRDAVVKKHSMKIKTHAIRIWAVWLFFGLLMAVFELSGVRLVKVFRDAGELAHVPFYFGLLSNLGVLVWAAGAFIPFYSSFLIRNQSRISLLRWAGILTFMLLLDDFLMIHDGLVQEVFNLPEYLVYIFYALAFPWFLFRHRQVILQQTDYWILALGFSLAGVSILIDIELLPGGIAAEDGFKIFGMVAYSYYWILTAKQMVSAEIVLRE